MEKRGRGKPKKYGERKSRSVRMPEQQWEAVQHIAASHGLDGVAELLIQIGMGKLVVVRSEKILHTHLTND